MSFLPMSHSKEPGRTEYWVLGPQSSVCGSRFRTSGRRPLMTTHVLPRSALALMVGALALVFCRTARSADPPKKAAFAWTYEDAKQAYYQAPDDPYAQFLLLQVGRQTDNVADSEESIRTRQQRRFRGRGGDIDLFSLFSGALAVQESLQLDTLLGNDDDPDTRGGDVPVVELKGPGVSSHPWTKMLGGRTPAVSELSLKVPADFSFVESRSLTKLLNVLDSGDLWQQHIAVQTGDAGTTPPIAERIRSRLAVQVDPLLRPVYDAVVDRVAIVSSDLYFGEGTDVTMLFSLKQPEVFRLRMDGFLASASQRPHATKSSETYREIEITHVETPDSAVDVFSAWPEPDLHVRSTSAVAIRQVLDVILSADNGAASLGNSEEYKYIRTLMPQDAAEEDVLVYLSDPFIRRILGPKVKLAERRRLIGQSHLRTLGYAAVLFQAQFGRAAKSVDELVDTRCAPAGFKDGSITSPFGGAYSLMEDGLTAKCSVLGTANALTPISELKLDEVTSREAEQYRVFVTEYEQYWRQYFDPIAIRVQATPERYRAETIVLPLINNSLYQGLASTVGGEPSDLESLPIPESNIGSVAIHLNKEAIRKSTEEVIDVAPALVFNNGPRPPDVGGLIRDGIGDTVSFNICDSDPLFDLNLTQFGAMMFRFGGVDRDAAPIGMMVASLTSPVYMAIPVKKAEVVDEFLTDVDRHLSIMARQDWGPGFFEVQPDYYLVDTKEGEPAIRVMAVRLGPATWRFFWARIGDGLYIASRKEILDEIAALEAAPRRESSPSSQAHVLLRARPDHWKKVMNMYRLSWAESARRVGVDNVSRLSLFVRSYLSMNPEAGKTDADAAVAGIVRLAEQVHGVRFSLPDGGTYLLAKDRRSMTHSNYGNAMLPHQKSAPDDNGELMKAVREFSGLTAELTFLDDGLHGVITVERRPAGKAKD